MPSLVRFRLYAVWYIIRGASTMMRFRLSQGISIVSAIVSLLLFDQFEFFHVSRRGVFPVLVQRFFQVAFNFNAQAGDVAWY